MDSSTVESKATGQNTLLPCPFCQIEVAGKFHELIEHPDVDGKPCPLNGGVFFGFTRWNQRTTPSSDKAQAVVDHENLIQCRELLGVQEGTLYEAIMAFLLVFHHQRQGLRIAHRMMQEWFSSEYINHPQTKLVGEALELEPPNVSNYVKKFLSFHGVSSTAAGVSSPNQPSETQEDTKRLDWLEENVNKLDPGLMTWRDAIDTAMAASIQTAHKRETL